MSESKRALIVKLNPTRDEHVYLISLTKAYTAIARKLNNDARSKFMELTTNGLIEDIKQLKDIKKKFYSWYNEYFRTQRK